MSNTGHWNTGNWNTGHWNTGHWNTGNRNTGDRNTGHCNTGDCNTGHWNTGHWNTGNRNTGDRNTGDCNTGHCNTGDCNTGHWNTGHWNTGDRNTGDWNTGHRNTGFFCTETPAPMFFDKPCNLTWDEALEAVPHVDLPIGCEWVSEANMTDAEKAEHPNYATIGGYLKKCELTLQQAFPMAWAKMDAETKQKFLDLPNFDAEKFLACTGVDVRTPDEPDAITVNGVKYRRV